MSFHQLPLSALLPAALLPVVAFALSSQFLSFEQHISMTSTLCQISLPGLLPVVAFTLSGRFPSFQQNISMISLPNLVLIRPFLLPSLISDAAFSSSA
jgi:hypothetical protein